MSVSARIGVFIVGLLVVFAAAVGIGALTDPAETEGGAGHDGEEHAVERQSDGMEDEMEAHGAHDAEQMRQAPAGLAVAEGGYSLHLDPTFFSRNDERQLRFTIDGADGKPVSDFDELHERRMHLILVRRDGSDFRHLHPDMDEAGTWTLPIEFGEAGVYRAFADFSVGGEQHTLASDLFVSGGDFEARPLPPPAPLDSTSGYEVRLRAQSAEVAESSSLSFAVSKDGAAVDDLAPYLGAKGHLVALREGDLAFLHVHPEETGSGHDPKQSGSGHGHGGHPAQAATDEIAFAASFPTAGRYRLYLQFKHEGAVRTAQFTVSVPR